MISAKEAKEKVINGKSSDEEKQLKMVEKEINRSIEKGLYHAAGGEYLKKSVIYKLINKGYEASTDYDRRGNYWKVSWK